MDRGPFYCICGKICTSRAGLVLHHLKCKKAKEMLKKHKPAIKTPSVIMTPDYTSEVKIFLTLVEDIAYDMNLALVDKNKSAARRARINLIKLRNDIVVIRKRLLSKIKGI